MFLLGSESVPDERDELLLSLVRHPHVVDELRELPLPVPGQHERLPGLGEEVDELGVVAGGDGREAGVGGGHEGGHGGVEQQAGARETQS